MTLTMHKGNDNSYVMLTTKDERLDAYWCSDYDGAGTYFVTVDADAIYEELSELAAWVNNVVNEEFRIKTDCKKNEMNEESLIEIDCKGNEMNTTMHVDLSKIYNKTTFGRPMTPGYWVTKSEDVQYFPITRLDMSCGGGMGGSRWYEYIVRVPLEELAEKERVVVTTWDGECKLINMNNVVKAEEYTVASAFYHSDNRNFPVGDYLVARLVPDGTKIQLINEFQGD